MRTSLLIIYYTFAVVKLCGNALKDRRLRKLVENPRTTPEQVVKYIRAHCPKQPLEEAADDDKETQVANYSL